ncbi:hypothetical protein RIVM261_078470 [Rivularia sp. IAM M-261]|nr:hypothetical protein RIVM261_078470 [Rivularia sp. IAM M-261]
MTKYLDFLSEITERGDIKKFIESDVGVQQQEGKLISIFTAWWQLHSPSLGDLPKTKKVMELRAEFVNSFIDSLVPVGLLDRFKVAGVVASWWEEQKYELRTLSESGFDGLIDSWVDTIKDALEEDEDDDKKSKPTFDPLNHKLVVRLLSDYLAEIATAEANIAELEQQKEAMERGDDAETVEVEDDEGEDLEASNNFKNLEIQLKHLKSQVKVDKKELILFKKSPLFTDVDKLMEVERRININEL